MITSCQTKLEEQMTRSRKRRKAYIIVLQNPPRPISECCTGNHGMLQDFTLSLQYT